MARWLDGCSSVAHHIMQSPSRPRRRAVSKRDVVRLFSPLSLSSTHPSQHPPLTTTKPRPSSHHHPPSNSPGHHPSARDNPIPRLPLAPHPFLSIQSTPSRRCDSDTLTGVCCISPVGAGSDRHQSIACRRRYAILDLRLALFIGVGRTHGELVL